MYKEIHIQVLPYSLSKVTKEDNNCEHGIVNDMKHIISDKRESPVNIRLILLMICIVNIGYNTMFSTTHIMGNKFYVSQLMSLF